MISAVIRSRNEERYIGYAIQSVIDHIPNAEIIVIDDHSTDETLNIVKQFGVDIYNIEEYTPGKALNMGVVLAKHDKVLFLSAHCEIVKWVEPYCGAVFGKQIPIYNGQKIPLTDMWQHFDDKVRYNYYSNIEGRYFLHNAFAVYDKKLLEKYPIDEKVEGKEDRLWAADVVDRGINYLYEPTLVCHHHYTQNGATWKYSDELRKEARCVS